MQQFAALGYIEDPGADKEKAAESAEIEAKYNVSRTYLWKGRPDQAQPLLEEIVRRKALGRPLPHAAGGLLFSNGYLAQAERVLRAIADGGEPDAPATLLLFAKIKIARGDLGGGLKGLLDAEAMDPSSPNIYLQIGQAYERLLQWDNARVAYERATRSTKTTRSPFKALQRPPPARE